MAWICKVCGHNRYRIIQNIGQWYVNARLYKNAELLDYDDVNEDSYSYEIACEECDNDSDTVEDIAEWREEE